MLHTNTLPMRSAALSSSLKPQPARLLLLPLTPSCCAATSTTTTTTKNPRRFFQSSSSRPVIITSTHNSHKSEYPLLKNTQLTQQQRRFESTSTSTPPLSPSPIPSTSPTSPSTPPPTLPWNAYLSLRKTRRRYNLASSLLSSLLTTAGGVSLISRLNLESMNVFGLDPFLVLGLSTVGSGGVGWLLGPFLGNAVFRVAYRRLEGQIDEKELDFYNRIKKHRVDPSGGSSANPVPDYYGEKIGSVKEYRNWMKDQRAFNKRRQNFL